MRLFAGIDGGASTTRARVVDCNGSLVGEGLAGPASLTISPEIAAGHVRQALGMALQGSGWSFDACQLVAGIAGNRQVARLQTFRTLLQDIASLEVISDGYAALLGAHGGAPGAIVIVGTGSVGLWLDQEGTVHQVGGWGPVCGDEGSGNWLGRKAVHLTLRAYDQLSTSSKKPPPLLEAIYRKIGANHEAILDWLASADATSFGALMPLILEHEKKGDLVAKALLADAASETGRLIRLAGGSGALNVALAGGLAEVMLERLDSDLTLTAPIADALEGALHRARGLAPPETYVQSAA